MLNSTPGMIEELQPATGTLAPVTETLAPVTGRGRFRRTAVDGHGKVSVIIPAKNEAENIGWVLDRLPSRSDEIIVVDGCSTDETVHAARAMRPDVRILAEQQPGKGAALRTGFAAATGDLIVMLDADGSMDPAEITRYIELLERGCDVVKGSRFVVGGGTADMTLVRRSGNRALLGLVNALYGSSLTDLCYGFFGFRREALEALTLRSVGFEIETEMTVRTLRARLTIAEVPSYESPRRHGESNLNAWRDGRRVLRTVLSDRFQRPAPRAVDMVKTCLPADRF